MQDLQKFLIPVVYSKIFTGVCMTIKEYYKCLSEIKKNMDNLSDEEFEELILEQKSIKPFRLDLACLETEKMMRNPEKYSNPLGKISGLYNTGICYEGVERALGLTRDIYRAKKSEYNARRMENKLALLQDDYGNYEKLYSKCRAFKWERIEHNDAGLSVLLYAVEDIITYILHIVADRKLKNGQTDIPEFDWVYKQTNMGFFMEELKEDRNNPFVLIENENNKFIIEFVKTELLMLNKKVIYVKSPLRYENDIIPIEKTLDISIGSIKSGDGMYSFVPVEIARKDGIVESNLDLVLEYIWSEFAKEIYLNVVTDGFQFGDLNGCKKIFRLSANRGDYQELNMCYGIYGDYLSYISNIYDTDCKKLISTKASKKFSIVIPARNSATTLRHTIKTCLEQTYQGNYEIIISDNSTDNNKDVYNLCQELNDQRIVYLKTPRDLHLPKSFEYAYLHSAGEYIMALGSDDGLLPWALEIIDAVTGTYPNEEILQWERGFYAWPGFNGGQENQFVIPKQYQKGEIGLFYRDRANYLTSILDNVSNMYNLPMLYINSCFKRSYLNVLLEKTGRLWDGMCQDIYMGVVTAGLHDKILNMRYPLTIAGMSKGSVGANANKGKVTSDELEKMLSSQKKDNNVGGYCRTYMEGFVPDTGTDSSSLYACVMRSLSVGVFGMEEIWAAIDWKCVFQKLYSEMDVRELTYEKKIHEMRYVASKHGEEFLEWFDKNIYQPALEPVIVDEVKVANIMKKKSYKEEKFANGGVVLDASEYGVENIYDATKLFAKFTLL